MTSGINRFRTADGKLISYAWPGGYPILYYDADNSALCPDCANDPDIGGPPVTYGEVFYEGAPEQCTECGKVIESAYGDPDKED